MFASACKLNGSRIPNHRVISARLLASCFSILLSNSEIVFKNVIRIYEVFKLQNIPLSFAQPCLDYAEVSRTSCLLCSSYNCDVAGVFAKWISMLR